MISGRLKSAELAPARFSLTVLAKALVRSKPKEKFSRLRCWLLGCASVSEVRLPLLGRSNKLIQERDAPLCPLR
jgi:hypothetical protein